MFTYADGITFAVGSRGDEISVAAPPEAEWSDVATYLLGPILGLALRRRGYLCLHASVVELAGRAVAIVGNSGAGKSTLAAYLALQGAGILTDDLCVLTRVGGVWHVLPGIPTIRLWPDAARLLFGPGADLPRLTPAGGVSASWDKRFWDAGERFVDVMRPLAGAYVLENYSPDLTGPAVSPVPPREAWLAMARHTYAAYVDAGRQAAELAGWAGVLRQAWVRDLAIPESGASLAALADVVRLDALR